MSGVLKAHWGKDGFSLQTDHKKVDFYLSTCGYIPSFLHMFSWKPVRTGSFVFGPKWMCQSWDWPTVPPVLQAFGGNCWSPGEVQSAAWRCVLRPGWSRPRLFTHAVPRGGRHPANWCHCSSAKATESPWKWCRDLDLLLSFSPAHPLFLRFADLFCNIPKLLTIHRATTRNTHTLDGRNLLIFAISAWIL